MFDAIYYCPPGVDAKKHQRCAEREVARGRSVSFHLHRQPDECVRGCWKVNPSSGPPVD